MKNFYSIIFIAFMGVLVFQGTSCKGPQPCKATITVVDSSGTKPQAGVAVHLYANVTTPSNTIVTADLTADGVTDASGQVSFTIKNPCILDIRASVPSCTTTIASHKYCLGTGIIKFDAGVTNAKTVNLNQ